MHVYEPGFLVMFSKLVSAESSFVPEEASSFSVSSRIYWVTPLLYAELNAPVVTQGYYLEDAPVAYP